MEEAVIVSYLRTPFSRARPREPERDAFNGLRMDDLAARLIQEMIKQTKINPAEIGDVLTGTAMPSSGSTGESLSTFWPSCLGMSPHRGSTASVSRRCPRYTRGPWKSCWDTPISSSPAESST
jgi:acetyl-CoA acetyltransferase